MASFVSRRRFLEGAISAGAVAFVPACSSSTTSPAAGGSDNAGADPTKPPTARDPDVDGGTGALPDDASTDGATPTPSCEEETEDDPEGPYYTAGAPTRTTLVEAGMAGTRLAITGRVLAAGKVCAPIAGAEVDVWQADDAGGYDNVGFKLRGVFIADAQGRFRIETIVPGRYLNGPQYRPRHIHVIIRAPGHAKLTTQLYWEGDPFNASDGMFKDSLVISPKPDGSGGESATFDFVIA